MSIGSNERYITTDVLVIGGGMAGMFAAIKAKEQGVNVILTDKAYVGKAGSTHFAEGDILFFRPELGHKLEEWMKIISKRSEYINNHEWGEICLKEAKARYDDLVSWGVQFYKKGGQNYHWRGTGEEPQPAYENITMQVKKYAPTLRSKVLDSGVRVLDNVMIYELLKQEGKVSGAIGIHIRSGNLYIIKSGAVVIATGTATFKQEVDPVNYWSGDGEAMAYRAGAQISGKELFWSYSGRIGSIAKNKISQEIVTANNDYPFAIGGGFTGWYMPNLNAEGGPVVNPAWEAHKGRAPLYYDLASQGIGRGDFLREFFKRIELGWRQADKIGLDVFQGGKVLWPGQRLELYPMPASSGIWPINASCAADVPGLYSAGNTCATMASGASYAGMGFGMNHTMVTGTRAGLAAAEYASKRSQIFIDDTEIARAKKDMRAPLERQGGFSPDWVSQVIHTITQPYFYLAVKHEKRLKAALIIVEFINSHLIPKLMANDAHEWRLALEARNVALNVEMSLRASLFRTESRGAHLREDYPYRDDPTWLAWVKIRDEQGEMKLYKEPIPEKWWPDLSKPYEERYSFDIPMD